jgi:hypothetical protein
VIDRALELQIRELVRREMDARLRSPVLNSAVSPRAVSQGRVAKRLVTRLPSVAQEFDEVHLESPSPGGSILPFIYHNGSWKPVGPAFERVTVVIGTNGPMPLDSAFTKYFDDTILEVFMAGSAYRGTAGLVGMNLELDGVQYANVSAYTNEINSHKAFVSRVYVHPNDFLGTGSFPAATYDVDLTPLNADSQTDTNDTFYVTITEKFAETN